MVACHGRAGGPHLPTTLHDRHLDHLVIHASGLGLEQTASFLGQQAPSFEEFERWIVATTGGVAPQQVARINAAVAGDAIPQETARWLAAVEASAPVLDSADLACWQEHGYVVLHDAVTPATREAAALALWRHLDADPDDPETWYPPNDHGIMVQYFQHPAFAAVRRSPRIHKAFAQLWGTADLWVTTDRVGFNAPEREGFMFPGPRLHWDVSVKTPIPLGTGGILYLTDTPPEQGAFTVVPGFQRWGEAWLNALPRGADPRQQDLYALARAPSAAAPAISSSGIRRCRTAPVPTAAPGRAWCNTSTCSRRGSRNMRSGFNQRTARRRGALSGSRSNKVGPFRLRAFDGEKPQFCDAHRPAPRSRRSCRRRPARDDRAR